MHYMVGAFLAGAVIDSDWFNQKQMDQLRHNVLLVVMPVFFLSTGLKTNWSVGGEAVFIAAGVLLLASVAGNFSAFSSRAKSSSGSRARRRSSAGCYRRRR